MDPTTRLLVGVIATLVVAAVLVPLIVAGLLTGLALYVGSIPVIGAGAVALFS